MNIFRTGQGYDAHRLENGRKLILCGVEIPYDRGLFGHSDADVAAHALTDALIGSLALGDIGSFFPDSDPAYKNADSMKLLEKALSHPSFSGWKISNVDLTIVAQQPKIAPYVPQMRTRIAKILGIPLDCVSVKGKTTEGMGFCGRGEGIEAFASVLIYKVDCKNI